MNDFFIINTKAPHRKIKRVAGVVRVCNKTTAVLWTDRYGIAKRSILGVSAFPKIESAIAAQNFRCHVGMMRLSRYSSPVLHHIKNQFEIRLSTNIKQMRKNYDIAYRHNL